MSTRPRPRQPTGPKQPWDPIFLEPSEISAVKAIAASQSLGFAAILKLCRVDEMSFSAGGEDGRRATDYAEGKRSVGVTLRALVAMKLPTPGRGAPPADLPNSETK